MDFLERRKAIEQRQFNRLHVMLQTILPTNAFYEKKLSAAALSEIASMETLRNLPLTTKSELVADQQRYPPFGSNLTFPLDRYIRIHQTSGTTGSPLYWLDTEESWQWWAKCWELIFEAAGVHPGDRVYFPFSFGPFIGFWAGWEGARQIGALAISGGSHSTAHRLKSILDYDATVLVCTPTYALHMATEAKRAGIDLARRSAVRTTIHAGEPGASIASTKKRIEESWGARCFDHAGATEVGAFGFECQSQPGAIHVNENEFIVEIIDPMTAAPTNPGERGELVITNLGRLGSPVIRYRTGDLVEPRYQFCHCGRPYMLLNGGVLGRVDDMIIVRGVNVFPGAIENILREFPEIEEFRVEVFENEAMKELKLVVELSPDCGSVAGLTETIGQRVRQRLAIRAHIESVPPGALPRFELKAKRIVKR